MLFVLLRASYIRHPEFISGSHNSMNKDSEQVQNDVQCQIRRGKIMAANPHLAAIINYANYVSTKVFQNWACQNPYCSL